MGPLVQDSKWVRQSFLVLKEDLEPIDQSKRTFSSASLKFTDTTLGGNFAINPPPQFTRFADPRAKGRYFANRTNDPGKGMGRYYSEAIDDNAQLIHMRFGVPQFNSLSTFFTGFYNSGAGQLARTGRANSAFYYLGRAAGFVVSVMSWQLLAVHLLGVGLRFALQKPSSKFYYLKPAMPLYWNAVTTIVNHLAVNRGIVPRVGGEDSKKIDGGYEFDAAGLEKLHDLLPDVFRKNGGIDVYAVANRAQRLARQNYKNLQAALDSAGNMSLSDLSNVLTRVNQINLTDTNRPSLVGDDAQASPDESSYLGRWFKSQQSQPKAEGDASSGTEELKKDETSNAGFFDFLQAEFDDGGAFATFRVNATGHINESFSNSVTESELSSKMNSMSSQSRSSSFNFGNGNIVGGAVGELMGGAFSAVKDFASGALDQLQISGLAALGGAAFVDIPKHWQSSTASLPRASYTIDLVSPYGNPISQLMNLYLPLSMLLAGALPLSTGKQSFTSPFILELYDKGRCQTRLGMIDSLSITRGTGNLGYTNEGHALGIQVSFSIVDMSSVLHMPISEGFSLTQAVVGAAAGTLAGATAGPGGAVAGAVAGAAVAEGIFDDDTVFSDYMAVLSGMSLPDQIYSYRKLKLNLTRKMADFKSWTSPAHFASVAGDTLPGRLISAFYRGIDQ